MKSLRDRRAPPIRLTFGFVAAVAWVCVVRGAGMDARMSEMDSHDGHAPRLDRGVRGPCVEDVGRDDDGKGARLKRETRRNRG